GPHRGRLDHRGRQAPQGLAHPRAAPRRRPRGARRRWARRAGRGAARGQAPDGRPGLGERGVVVERRAPRHVSGPDRPRRRGADRRRRGPRTGGQPPAPRPNARAVALDALDRIESGGAYANLVLPELLARSGLAERDRHFVTELVYGTTRMRRACDHLVDRFLTRDVEPRVRSALRLGAYQLHHLALPPHAAVGETVGVAPR